MVVVAALRTQIPVSHEESMRWVDDDFEAAAGKAYSALREPSLDSLLSGWEIFSSMARIITFQDCL
jgi:hypothetical protein